jgi:hypothetical protein
MVWKSVLSYSYLLSTLRNRRNHNAQVQSRLEHFLRLLENQLDERPPYHQNVKRDEFQAQKRTTWTRMEKNSRGLPVLCSRFSIFVKWTRTRRRFWHCLKSQFPNNIVNMWFAEINFFSENSVRNTRPSFVLFVKRNIVFFLFFSIFSIDCVRYSCRQTLTILFVM